MYTVFTRRPHHTQFRDWAPHVTVGRLASILVSCRWCEALLEVGPNRNNECLCGQQFMFVWTLVNAEAFKLGSASND